MIQCVADHRAQSFAPQFFAALFLRQRLKIRVKAEEGAKVDAIDQLRIANLIALSVRAEFAGQQPF